MRRLCRLWGVIGLATLGTASMTRAQEGTTLELGANAPVLGQHRFSPISTLKHPFITTFVRSTLGMGQAKDVDLGTVVVGNDTLVSFQGDLLFLQLQFEYQHAVKEWIAARVEIDVLGRLGTDLESLVADGVRTRLQLGSLNAIRDFVEVEFAVHAYQALATRGVAGEAYNVCSGVGKPVRELVAELVAESGLGDVPIEEESLPGRSDEIDASVGDGAKLAALLDASYTDS